MPSATPPVRCHHNRRSRVSLTSGRRSRPTAVGETSFAAELGHAGIWPRGASQERGDPAECDRSLCERGRDRRLAEVCHLAVPFSTSRTDLSTISRVKLVLAHLIRGSFVAAFINETQGRTRESIQAPQFYVRDLSLLVLLPQSKLVPNSALCLGCYKKVERGGKMSRTTTEAAPSASPLSAKSRCILSVRRNL